MSEYTPILNHNVFIELRYIRGKYDPDKCDLACVVRSAIPLKEMSLTNKITLIEFAERVSMASFYSLTFDRIAEGPAVLVFRITANDPTVDLCGPDMDQHMLNREILEIPDEYRIRIARFYHDGGDL